MMNFFYPFIFASLYVEYLVIRRLSAFYQNLQAARRTGLPYIVSPIWHLYRPWLIIESLILPHIRKIPILGKMKWVDIAGAEWAWIQKFALFEALGDTFIIVSPWRNACYTAEASVIAQICQRRNDFPKPLEHYGALGVYGGNVVGSEGNEWRRHRKITSPPFSERNNALVWKETLYQSKNMLKQWVGADGQGGATWDDISSDAMRLSLHVISRAGFNVRCLWPGIDDNDEKALREGAMSSAVVPEGHQMSYVEAMQTLLHKIIAIIICPTWLADSGISKYLKSARAAYFEWGQYMKEIFDRKYQELSHYSPATSDTDPSLDLMGAMIKCSGLLEKDAKKGNAGNGLTEREILGNSFVFMLAGHETAANVITNALYFLAMNPESQRRLHRELDDIFGGKDVSEWDYDRDLTPLFGGMVGAVMNETLRITPPVVIIPKSTYAGPQKVKLESGKDIIIPGDTYIGLHDVAAHRNPKYWPHGPARSAADGGPMHPLSNTTNDLEEFKPERWLLDPSQKPACDAVDEAAKSEADAAGVNTPPEIASTLFRPPKGAFFPFSEGFRACLGRRFAQVEILACLAAVLQNYSVELDLGEWASDEEVRKMDRGERRAVWLKARTQAEWLMNEKMGTIITIQLRGGKIPVRFVKRGSETVGA